MYSKILGAVMSSKTNRLEKELYALMQKDQSVFLFLEENSLDGIWFWDLENSQHQWMSPKLW
jgi:hypothetical protein